MKRKFLWVLLFLVFFVSEIFPSERPNPNIVILLIDDLGWQDVKCYDIDEESPYETPNIDKLAGRGVMFWEGYSPAPTCAPSRAAILSGNHPARANLTHVSGGQPPTPYNTNFRMMAPYYSGRMPEGEQTIARVLQENGYVTGHTGKWHVAVNHNAYPQPTDQGFDYSRHDLGVSRLMKPDRLSEFATNNPDDNYQLDDEGFPYDQTTQDALIFMEENKHKPLFLYYASWLVHTPIQTRSRDLLIKYCNKLGINVPDDPGNLSVEGQGNPYYCAMVEQMDYYVGQIIKYLDTTDDPRWPGHKLIENTYLFFTSDNGGYERPSIERITDNDPLDKGKISAKEGGTRVPFIVAGPGIAQGLKSNVMVNGLDLYPTILSLADIEVPNGKSLDGVSIKDLLMQDPTNPELVKTDSGTVRNTMVWHFPHGHANESTIRTGDFKLIRNYDYINNSSNERLDLYRLYHTVDNIKLRGDIEEAHRLNGEFPELTRKMDDELTSILEEMEARYSHYNPDYPSALPFKEMVPQVNSFVQKGDIIEFFYTEKGAEIITANLIYSLNGGDKYEEFFSSEAIISSSDHKIIARLPEGATHVFLNLIDQNNFLVSYPKTMHRQLKNLAGTKYSTEAIEIKPFQSKKKEIMSQSTDLPLSQQPITEARHPGQ